MSFGAIIFGTTPFGGMGFGGGGVEIGGVATISITAQPFVLSVSEPLVADAASFSITLQPTRPRVFTRRNPTRGRVTESTTRGRVMSVNLTVDD